MHGVISNITTADVQPDVAPHRISEVTSKDKLTFTLSLVQDDDVYPGEFLPEIPSSGLKLNDQHFMGYSIEIGGSGVGTGQILTGVNGMCSDEMPCSEQMACGGALDMTGGSIDGEIDSDMFPGEVDGTKRINVYLQLEARGWA